LEEEMEITEDRKAAVRRDFASRRRRLLLFSAPLPAVLAAIAVLVQKKSAFFLAYPSAMWATAGMVLVVGAVGFSLRNWRCPACGGPLGKAISPKLCGRCGVPLQ
jgi:hypothetical protein